MFEAVILGIIQGITEFLPISSTAHLILVPKFFGWQGTVDTLTFDIALHAGTLLAVLVYFIRDWVRIILHERRLLIFIIIATIPAGLTGIFLEDIVEKELRDPFVVALSLSVIGFFMLLTDRLSGKKNIEELRFIDCLFIGLFQTIALIPGVSRSGITIAAGFLMGLKREDSARFSFLLSTPVIAGASLIGFKRLIHEPQIDYSIFLSGMIASFISGLIAIGFLIKYLQRHRIDLFVYYRFGLAALIFLFF
ncbi:MAG: undecaprenyl-diphosphate phosphatase [Thermodesulfovibrionales bacterium]|nr:undecaprenyl-diphosphate phosphatase [Thermodesulfovibrionales bacterium]